MAFVLSRAGEALAFVVRILRKRRSRVRDAMTILWSVGKRR